MVCLFFVIKIPCTGYPYIWSCLVRDVSRVWSSSSSAPEFFSVPASCAFTATVVMLKLYKYIFVIALPASVNSQCKIVERAEWSWKNCTRLQKLGLKEEKNEGILSQKTLWLIDSHLEISFWVLPFFVSLGPHCHVGRVAKCQFHVKISAK